MTQLATETSPSSATSTSHEHLIQCARLTKVFKDFWLRDRVTAVNNIDLDVRRGEVFGLLGPNGSGKSTTIKMILGLLHPTSGIVSVFGKPARDVSVKKNIGYLPEESYLYRFLNARETLEYYGKLFHQDRRKRQQRIDMLLEMVGLDKVQRRPIGEYSKGMQRRIGLAQALINDPQLLILDEPTTGLDPIGTRQIKDLILRLRDTGKTVLLCSHLLSDVEDVTDRAAIMFGGKVRRSGTIEELLASEDQTTVTMPTLSSVDTEKLVAALEAMGVTEVQVKQSRQKLESLFLDIVHQAQAEGVKTAGAGNAGQVAAFLTEAEERSAHMPEDTDAAKVLDQLTSVTPVEPVSTPDPEPAPVAPEKAAADDVLSGLTGEKPQEPEPKTEAKPTPPPASPNKPSAKADQSVLDDLLG
ncbi:ABC transporter ATP-binding protein [Algisphaera agarilytica]|uniref:ABC-2 type transport system ATP-binding protein n=1 Tax=Algisphaera agarilytica TaxID=1385975 RepID=A0A7X0H8N4_9BACT|nr:ABC transporter ATP-binding protein [Algisphaera agarilytica]MBB6429850.1 ABC-2 type transport system ATP-binding protein [Algisphaera agarilytica]